MSSSAKGLQAIYNTGLIADVQQGRGIGRFFKKVNKVVSGLGSVGLNAKNQVANFAGKQSGAGRKKGKGKKH